MGRKATLENLLRIEAITRFLNKLPCIILVSILIFPIFVQSAIGVELSRDILVIARHGSLENTPENTLGAFERTANVGVKGLEIDVRRTKDGKLILMHDATIDRTTTGKGYVSQLLYEEIKLYDAGSWKGEEFVGERVPLLSEALQFAKERKMKIIINAKEHGIEQQTLSLIEKFDMMSHVYFSGRLKNLRNKDIDVKGAQLVFLPSDETANEVIDFIHERGNHVGTRLFGTDDRDKMKGKMFQGVDIILTDYPSVAIDLLHFRTINKPRKREREKKLKTNIEGNTAQRDALIDAVTHGSPEQSRMAALVFSTLPAELAISPLVKHLNYKKPLKRFFPKIKIPFLFRKNDRSEDENLLPSDMVERNVVWALGLIKNSDAVGPLVKRLETANADLKREIILALKMISDPQAVPVLKEILLKDESPYVRFDAAKALGDIGSTDSVFTLIKVMKTDTNWLVRGGCAGALGKIGDMSAAYELNKLLNIDAGDDAMWARDQAAWALSKMGTGGIEALVSSLGAYGISTRRRASWALVDIGDPALPYLLSALKEISSFARKRAAMVLGWIGSKKAVIPLTWALADTNMEVRKMAAWALGRIGEGQALSALEHTIDDHTERSEKINSEIVVLNEQLKVLEDQIAILANDKRQRVTGKAKKQNEIAGLQFVTEQKNNGESALEHEEEHRLEIAVAEKFKIDNALLRLKKTLQENEGYLEYAREAVQRLNYN